MIIVRFQGGLGNQMFQYAIYRKLQLEGNIVKADLTEYQRKGNLRSFCVDKVFGIPIDIATKKEVFYISGGEKNFFEKAVRKYIKRKQVYKEVQIPNIDAMLKIGVGYLNGYWQSMRWFSDIEQILKNELIFQNIDEKFVQTCKTIAEEQSVSIHVRMGDYTNLDELYGGICTKDYYTKAIAHIGNQIENPTFYVVSDEPERAKELLGDIVDARYLENDHPDYWDMYFMSSCRHNILANSSFSWWSTFLNNHEDKIVVAPSKWNNFEDPRDIYVKEWTIV